MRSVGATRIVLKVTYTDAFEVRKRSSRQNGIDLAPFHEDTVDEAMGTVSRILKNADRDLFHVHRNDSRQDWSKPSVAFVHVSDIEVKETEVRIVM